MGVEKCISFRFVYQINKKQIFSYGYLCVFVWANVWIKSLTRVLLWENQRRYVNNFDFIPTRASLIC